MDSRENSQTPHPHQNAFRAAEGYGGGQFNFEDLAGGTVLEQPKFAPLERRLGHRSGQYGSEGEKHLEKAAIATPDPKDTGNSAAKRPKTGGEKRKCC